MRRKEDARVIRTKAKLFASFRELLSEKTFEEITINEICIRSGIRRATFYKHFSDKYDFLAGLTRQLRRDFEESVWKEKRFESRECADYYIEYFKSLVLFLEKNSEIVDLVFKSNITASLIQVIVDENYVKTREKLAEDQKKGIKLIASADTVAIFLAGGISNALIKRLKNEEKMPLDSFIKEISALIGSVFAK